MLCCVLIDLQHDEYLGECGVTAVLPAEAAGEAGPGVAVLGLHVLHQAPASRVQAVIQTRVMAAHQHLACCYVIVIRCHTSVMSNSWHHHDKKGQIYPYGRGCT